MQLDGTLDKFSLRELIEMVVYSSVTGVLELRAAADVAQIYFRDGQPYHAAAGGQTGLDALAIMFEERDAPFRFVADRETTEATLWSDPWELIERAENQARRWRDIRAHIASVDHVPMLRVAPFVSQIQISEAVWPVLAAVDGQRSIQEIAAHLNWVLLDTCEALGTLVERGLLGMQAPGVVSLAPRPLAEQSGAGSPAEEKRPANGFLERLLAEAQAKEQQRPDLTNDEPQESKRYYRYVDDRR